MLVLTTTWPGWSRTARRTRWPAPTTPRPNTSSSVSLVRRGENPRDPPSGRAVAREVRSGDTDHVVPVSPRSRRDQRDDAGERRRLVVGRVDLIESGPLPKMTVTISVGRSARRIAPRGAFQAAGIRSASRWLSSAGARRRQREREARRQFLRLRQQRASGALDAGHAAETGPARGRAPPSRARVGNRHHELLGEPPSELAIRPPAAASAAFTWPTVARRASRTKTSVRATRAPLRVRDTSAVSWRARASESRTARRARAERRPRSSLPRGGFSRAVKLRAPTALRMVAPAIVARTRSVPRSRAQRATADTDARPPPTRTRAERERQPSTTTARGRAYTPIERPATSLPRRASGAPRTTKRPGSFAAAAADAPAEAWAIACERSSARMAEAPDGVHQQDDQQWADREQGTGGPPGQHRVILPLAESRRQQSAGPPPPGRIRDSCVTVLSTTRCGTSRWRPPRSSPTT